MKLNNNRKKRVFWSELSELDRRLEESKDEEKLKVVKDWILGICQKDTQEQSLGKFQPNVCG